MKSKALRIKEKRTKGFLKFPRKLIELVLSGDVSDRAFSLYLVIINLAVYSENSSYYGCLELNPHNLSEIFSKSSNTVSKNFNELLSLGLINKVDKDLIEVINFKKLFDDTQYMEEASSDLVNKVSKMRGEISHMKS
ncbi:MAG: hypothetical protein GW762_02935 [Candidatus Pacebacteria bacterium]|nr:hypothetical protein [Candidatus Paceibacterota bacterium]PIR63416.1 MAG: hypothetical protein COU64_04430 [Candidatus Pacebacteria bacterium CG10_big_fil_rev_8_21_14_0_10_40_26]PIZ79553.1 MAG: hypothetical protein COY01_00330 [Candidatus Pacebacteria bacterium CG_4_10_14_0_2_um_filter_40_20]PJA69006.1 MAG: hypothetical protein CO156_01580 [Candidatus Pacebacteria bacterium CG_4_9_14_3_um_filter_40_12]PJC41861.1 MAG: hypothetical protein CO041_04025 [Candidatus Pacebacteria bacterium CG_4_9_